MKADLLISCLDPPGYIQDLAFVWNQPSIRSFMVFKSHKKLHNIKYCKR